MITITKITDLETIRADWTALFERADASPFLSWEWSAAWLEKLAPEREVVILEARRGDEIVGLLPLGLKSVSRFGLKVRRLGFLGDEIGGADYLDLIASEVEKPAIWKAIFDYLIASGEFDAIRLENVAATAATAAILEKLCNETGALKFSKDDGERCPRIDLTRGWDEILRASRRKDNFKRRLKKLEKTDGFEFRSVTDATEITAAFERFAALHERRWENDGGSAATGLPKLMEFHRTVVASLAERGVVRFDEIWAEGECRASVYGLDDRDGFYYYNAGYDLAWANRSVGLVLIGLSIRAAAARGNRVYDFLRGDETYKFDWSDSETRLVNLRLGRPNFLANLDRGFETAWNFTRDTAKTLLPAEFAATLRGFMRKRRA